MPQPTALFPARLTIDLDALCANWRRLSKEGEPAECGAVVKADAYGLGGAAVAPALAKAGCRSFFVAFLEEGVRLRALIGGGPAIHVMCASQWDDPALYRDHALTPVLSTSAHLKAWGASGALEFPFLAQVETGMNRLGLAPEMAGEAARLPACLGLMSHLACADEPASPLNAEQLARFRAIVAALPARSEPYLLSLANSAGIFLGAPWRFDLTRPGIALYGGNPQPGRPNPMRPVVTLEAPVLQLRETAAGETVGYGASFRCKEKATIAIVPVGYADGLNRTLSNRGHAASAGHRVPYAGRVSMDMLALDVSAVPAALLKEAPVVQLMGPDVAIDGLAEEAGTISYEMLTHLGSRFHRIYRGG
jgi:alanine racemase